MTLMTFCDEVGCLNIRYDHMLEQDVCDQRYPEPEGCPLIEEQKEEFEKKRNRKENKDE